VAALCFAQAHGKKGRVAMAIPTRAPFIRYLLAHAAVLRLPGTRQAAAESLDQHACALELLANHVRGLAEDDERLLLIGTLAVRGGELLPGPATEHALSRFTGASAEECDGSSHSSATLRDDALNRAREFGFLPPRTL
jgi:hypothetical protein